MQRPAAALTRCSMLAACLALLAALPHAALAASACACENISLASKPVCGQNGITYVNRCVAECQHVDVASKGACRRAAGSAGSDAAAATAANDDGAAADVPFLGSDAGADVSVGLDVLGRFADQGFTFAARLQRGAQQAQRAQQDGSDDAAGQESQSFQASTRSLVTAPGLYAMRLTAEGDLYFRRSDTEHTREGGAEGATAGRPGFRPGQARTLRRALRSRGGARKMLEGHITGTDDRQEAHDHDWPYRAVGRVGPGCSGALIGPNAVLTAGHCVFDPETDTWQADASFTPGVSDGGPHADSDGTLWDPLTYSTSTVTTWFHLAEGAPCSDGGSGCTSLADRALDIAVVHLNENAGDSYGWLGWGYNCGQQQYPVRIFGYPADLDSTMTRTFWMDGTLNSFDACEGTGYGIEAVISSDLDVYGGYSGAPIFEMPSGEEAIVRAVHVASSDDGAYHRALTAWLVDELEKIV